MNFFRKKIDHVKIVFIENMIIFAFKILSNKLCRGGKGCCRVLILLLNLETCLSEQVDLLSCFILIATKSCALLTWVIGSCQTSKWNYTERPVSKLESVIKL